MDIIGPLVIRRKGKEEKLHLQYVTTINPVTGCIVIAQYGVKNEISITDLVKTTWLSIYPRPIEITYDQGNIFIGHEFRKSITETEHGITERPSNLGNPISNAVLERIHQILRNLVRTFDISTQTHVGENDPWTVLLDAAVFAILSTTNRKTVIVRSN